MKRLLFVEDDAEFLQVYEGKLRQDGYSIDAAKNADAAMTMLKSSRYDCVILDIMLQGPKNGFDILESMKGNAVLKSIPVVILTNLDSEDRVAKEIGANAYLVKTKTSPGEVSALIAKLAG